MKTLLTLTLALLCLPFTGQAQTVTNVTIKVTVDVINTGVSTNSVNSTLKFDSANKNDLLRNQGWAFAYGAYVTAQGTNTPVAFENYVKQQVKALSDNYAGQVQQAQNAATLTALTKLLTLNFDLLSISDISNLQTIAAKAP